MATRSRAAATRAAATPPAAYDPEGYYSVQLARAVEYPAGSGHLYTPANRITMLGAVVEAVKDAVHDAVAV